MKTKNNHSTVFHELKIKQFARQTGILTLENKFQMRFDEIFRQWLQSIIESKRKLKKSPIVRASDIQNFQNLLIDIINKKETPNA